MWRQLGARVVMFTSYKDTKNNSCSTQFDFNNDFGGSPFIKEYYPNEDPVLFAQWAEFSRMNFSMFNHITPPTNAFKTNFRYESDRRRRWNGPTSREEEKIGADIYLRWPGVPDIAADGGDNRFKSGNPENIDSGIPEYTLW